MKSPPGSIFVNVNSGNEVPFNKNFCNLNFQLQHPNRSNLLQKYFCAVYDYAGKADLSNGYCNPK